MNSYLISDMVASALIATGNVLGLNVSHEVTTQIWKGLTLQGTQCDKSSPNVMVLFSFKQLA